MCPRTPSAGPASPCGRAAPAGSAALQAQALEQFLVELRLDRADGDVLAVLRLVDVVPGRAGVEHVLAALLAPAARGEHAGEHRRQQRGAVDHRGVDHLALARALRLEQRAGDAEGEQHAAAAEVADQVERRHRRLAVAADGVQRAGERDVVDVVAGARRQRPVLAPAGHAAVDQPRIAREQRVGPEAQPLHHAGPEALDQRVGARRRARAPPRRRPSTSGRASTERRPRIITSNQRSRPKPRRGSSGRSTQQHVGAHVGEQHAAERPRADALRIRGLSVRRAVPWAVSLWKEGLRFSRKAAMPSPPSGPCTRRRKIRVRARGGATGPGRELHPAAAWCGRWRRSRRRRSARPTRALPRARSRRGTTRLTTPNCASRGPPSARGERHL